jgi:UDP-N-acetylmuramoyl-tripeptide--D-alanyl-D-alanine ligase
VKEIFKKAVVRVLALESKLVLKKYKPKVVGVTGTVGKTSTKDAIYTALSRTLSVRKAKKSQNSEIGLPLTILGAENPSETLSVDAWLSVMLEGAKLILLPNHYPEWLVLEIGADHPGDIERAVEWVRPDVAVVTKLSKVPVHVEFFPSVEDVIAEKSFLIRALKANGTLVLNADDEDVMKFRELAPDKQAVLFGQGENADIAAENYEIMYGADDLPEGIKFDVDYRAAKEKFPVILKGTIGNHLIYPILASLAVTEALRENVQVAAKAFRTHEPTPGRMRLVEGVDGSIVIDDTYNSSPVAATEALHTLKAVKGKRKIAVLGDMLELGKFSIDEHKKLGKLAGECADILITIGQRSQYAAETARAVGLTEVYEFGDSREAGKFVRGILKQGDIVLVKGSQGVRAERVVEAVMKHPEDKEKLLVRQDKEWVQRDRKAKKD